MQENDKSLDKPAESQAKTKVKKSKKKPSKRKARLFILLLFLILIGWKIIGVHIPYSDGERASLVVKLSQKGIFWKTWEGEAALYQGGFAATYVWPFSIDSADPNKEEILRKLQYAFQQGIPVKLKYEQMLSTVPWRGQTSYFVKDVIFVR